MYSILSSLVINDWLFCYKRQLPAPDHRLFQYLPLISVEERTKVATNAARKAMANKVATPTASISRFSMGERLPQNDGLKHFTLSTLP